MRSAPPAFHELIRVRIAQLAMLAAFVFLGTALWRVQVLHTTRYTTSLDRQSMRRVRLPGVRGRILDRNGACLADNRPSYGVAIYIEELRQSGRWSRTIDEVEALIDRLAAALQLDRQVTREEIGSHIRRRLPLPFLAWRDVDERALARLAESTENFPGVDIYVEAVRTYPRGTLAAHVLGYVGRAEPAEASAAEPFDYYLPELEGMAGIEHARDATLRGEAGGRLLRVDASGFKHTEAAGREPRRGLDVCLALDARVQGCAERAVAGQQGACVVLDPRNGDVLGMASSPVFDPNALSPRLSVAEWRAVSTDAGKPLFNRAVSGMYAPGSTFKPLVAMAALENARATPDTTYTCTGECLVGNVSFRCWLRTGHGEIGLRKALEQSCNCFFFQLGLDCGYPRVCHMAAALGLGRRTGVGLPFEAAGLLPDNAWKERYRHDSWRAGDTCNAAIGQGALSVTPLQMAVVTAALANGGFVYRPRLLLDAGARGRGAGLMPGDLVNRLGWSAASLAVVRGGMYDVVQAESGTGKRARVPGVEMAGKTGTAEYGRKVKGRNYAWMIAFAPFESPRYAAAIVVEEGASGGRTAAPAMQILMAGLLGVELPPSNGAG